MRVTLTPDLVEVEGPDGEDDPAKVELPVAEDVLDKNTHADIRDIIHKTYSAIILPTRGSPSRVFAL